MKLIFTKPKGTTTFSSNLLAAYWATHGIHFANDKVKVSYNSFHNFWDINIERGILYKSGNGCGTPLQQVKLWESQLEKLKELHPNAKFIDGGWTWEHITDAVYIEPDETLSRNGSVISCPVIRIWIKAEE
jgi:hypothetical protein